MNNAIPLIDFSNFNTNKSVIAKQVNQACLQHGFFYVSGHGVSSALQTRLESLGRYFFALPQHKYSVTCNNSKNCTRRLISAFDPGTNPITLFINEPQVIAQFSNFNDKKRST